MVIWWWIFGNWLSSGRQWSGEWQDIQQLGECSHLMFDFVCNHMSAKSEWFKNYLQQQPGFEDFFIAVDPKPISAPSLARVRYRY